MRMQIVEYCHNEEMKIENNEIVEQKQKRKEERKKERK